MKNERDYGQKINFWKKITIALDMQILYNVPGTLTCTGVNIIRNNYIWNDNNPQAVLCYCFIIILCVINYNYYTLLFKYYDSS